MFFALTLTSDNSLCICLLADFFNNTCFTYFQSLLCHRWYCRFIQRILFYIHCSSCRDWCGTRMG